MIVMIVMMMMMMMMMINNEYKKIIEDYKSNKIKRKEIEKKKN